MIPVLKLGWDFLRLSDEEFPSPSKYHIINGSILYFVDTSETYVYVTSKFVLTE